MPLRREGVQRVPVLISSLDSIRRPSRPHATSYPNYYRILWNNANADSAVKTNQNGVANAICASTWHWCYDSYSNMICPKDLPSSAKNAVKLAATVLQPQSMNGEEEPIV